jgi:subtilisin family serine protease
MAEKEYIVVLKKGVDYDAFWDQIENASEDDGFVPTRRVDIVNNRDGSLRSCHYSLSNEEAEILQNDPRIYSVEIPPDQRDDIELVRNAVQSGTWRKSTGTFSNDINWGLLRGASSPDQWGGGTTILEDFNYNLTGKGVDVVVHDSGLSINHPEFTDANGVSRVQQINWFTESGLSGTQSANHYRDYHGHGSHVAGTMAGRTQGWARDARIYALKVNGLEGSGDSGTGISITNCFDVVKLWHRNKPIDPATGFKRPTVVNMSWGYGGSRTSATLTNGTYRGTPWTNGTPGFTNSTAQWGSAGIIPAVGINRYINVRVGSVDADLQELIDEGVHVCIAAGNSFYYIAAEGDQDWDNSADFGFGQEFYHRGSSPYSTGAFIVGNMDITYQGGLEHKSESSCTGPGVDIYAPGTSIMSPASTDKSGGCDLTDGTQSSATTVNSALNASYKLMKISGTSMASPNVAGMAATILEANPGMTPAQMKTYLHNNATQGLLYDGATDNWSDQDSVQGGPNRIFKTPFTNPVPITMNNITINKI